MKNKSLNYDNWLKLTTRIVTRSYINRHDWNTLDMTNFIPSLTKLDEHNIIILNDPYFIVNDTDCLKYKSVDIEDFENELKNITHLYDIKENSSVNPDDFTMIIKLYIRGVFKE